MTQKEALLILKTGANVFLTGEAGSGKTHVLREYLKYLDENKVVVGKTASTGIAATHMGGVTIHSWSGIGVKDSLTGYDLDDIREKSYLQNRISKADVLVIDEISMMHHFRFEMVDRVLRTVRDREEPFGGMQVVVSGDFFQLPPVSRAYETKGQFAYHSRSWQELDFRICYLEEQYRQTDKKYNAILNAIRSGRAEEVNVKQVLASRLGSSLDKEFKTKLYTHNVDVDAENERELGLMQGELYEYQSKSRGRGPLVEALKKSCLAPETLRLKKGAQVMFVKNNFELGYANGTLGTVLDCKADGVSVRLRDHSIIEVEPELWRIEEDGKVKAEISQFPLRLAWAITIHKSQGMSLDAAQVDLSKAFEKGMGYVALSRIRALEGLTLLGLNDEALKVDLEVLEIDRHFRSKSDRESRVLSSMEKGEVSKRHQVFLNRASGILNKKKSKKDTVEVTKDLILDGLSLKQIAKERDLETETIISHIEKIISLEPRFNLDFLKAEISESHFKKIMSAFHHLGVREGGKRPLAPVKKMLGEKFDFLEIRIVRLFL